MPIESDQTQMYPQITDQCPDVNQGRQKKNIYRTKPVHRNDTISSHAFFSTKMTIWQFFTFPTEFLFYYTARGEATTNSTKNHKFL